MADFKHRRDRGIVRFSGEINLAAAVDLVETVDLLTSVYFYDLIELQISSLGGVSTALEHYLAAHERWRAAGVRVRTRVVDRAASAAALLLSLGDERIAEPGAALVYHCFRVCSDAPVTATAAAVLFSDLADLDDRFLARLVNRALAGGVVTIAPGVDASDLPVLDRLTAALPAGAKPRPRSARGLARLLERAVRRAIRAKDRTALAAIYKTLCRSEVAISPAVACLLRLIDHVGDPPASPARAASAPGLVVPEWRLLYPDAGAVPREVLTRHMLALGDTGSGKTLSVVLPILLAALRAPIERFFHTMNKQLIHVLSGNTQLLRDPRRMSREVDPACDAVWSLEDFDTLLRRYLFEEYPSIPHAGLNRMTPAERFKQGAETLSVGHPLPDSADLRFLLWPYAKRRTATVHRQRGIVVQGVHYWNAVMSEPPVHRCKVEVRVDPCDAGHVVAYLQGVWRLCTALSYYDVFHGRSRRELRLAAAILRKRHRGEPGNSHVREKRLANLLRDIRGHEELAVRARYGAPALLWGECGDPYSPYTGAKIAYQSFPDMARLRWLNLAPGRRRGAQVLPAR